MESLELAKISGIRYVTPFIQPLGRYLTYSTGALLLRRLRQALEECTVQKDSFESFSAKQEDRVPVWTAMVEAYEADSTQPNPYEVAKSGLTEADIRLAFAKEEEEQAAKGIPAIHEVSPSTFIIAGLDLEEQQYVHSIARLWTPNDCFSGDEFVWRWN